MDHHLVNNVWKEQRSMYLESTRSFLRSLDPFTRFLFVWLQLFQIHARTEDDRNLGTLQEDYPRQGRCTCDLLRDLGESFVVLPTEFYNPGCNACYNNLKGQGITKLKNKKPARMELSCEMLP